MITIEGKEYSKEYAEKWRTKNFLPTNYFDLSVQERRDAFQECQRKIWARDGNPNHFEVRLANYRKSKDKKTKEHEFTVDLNTEK
jgi:hypothetical protein